MDTEYRARYSGPGRSGTCVCSHRWDQHHLGIVMRQGYVDATGEGYIPQECEAFGFNEMGGKQWKDGELVDHCHSYRDIGTSICWTCNLEIPNIPSPVGPIGDPYHNCIEALKEEVKRLHSELKSK